MSHENDEGMTKGQIAPSAYSLLGSSSLVRHPSFLKLVFARRARYPDRCSGACSKRRLAGEKIGATGFEPATCRRGDRSIRMR